jgi:predicted ABC-type exoprotein transport system permease subunit
MRLLILALLLSLFVGFGWLHKVAEVAFVLTQALIHVAEVVCR